MKIHNLHLRLLDALDAFTAYIHWLFSDERHDPYRCSHCGSTNVKLRAWIYPNKGNRYENDCEDLDREEHWCERCDGYTQAISTSGMLHKARTWWITVCGNRELERITGFRRTDFAPDDDYQAFRDACLVFWDMLSDEAKIELWIQRK